MEARNASATPFYLACVMLVAGSAAAAAVTRGSPFGIALFLAGLTGAMWFLVLPSWLEHKAQVLDGLALALQDLERRNYDLEGVRREHRRALAKAEELVERLGEALAAREDLQAARQEGQRLQRRLEAWEDALVGFSEDQFRLLSQDSAAAEYRDAAERTLRHLTLALQPLGLDLVRPGRGDPFDGRLHQAVDASPGDAPPDHVLTCRRLGVRRGDVVLRRAEVVLSTAPQEVPA